MLTIIDKYSNKTKHHDKYFNKTYVKSSGQNTNTQTKQILKQNIC